MTLGFDNIPICISFVLGALIVLINILSPFVSPRIRGLLSPLSLLLLAALIVLLIFAGARLKLVLLVSVTAALFDLFPSYLHYLHNKRGEGEK